MMRVALGTTVLRRGLAQGGIDGIGNYTRALLGQLAQQAGLDVLPFAYSGPDAPLAADPPLRAGDFQRQALLALLSGVAFPATTHALKGRVDLVHATDHLIPSVRGVPVVATLMDAIPLAHPEWVSYRFKAIKNALWRRSARWATHVITISSHARQELVEWFGIPEQRISVTPLGVDERWFLPPSAAACARVRAHHGLPQRFFVFVGTLQPRKNLGRVIAAHRALAPALRREVPLVVAGRAGWGCEAEVAALTEGDGGALRWLRHVPDEELQSLVSMASALAFPSLHEGFGLPVLEAFAAGTPVITSTTTSLPEVAGDAALLVDPRDEDAIAGAMLALIETPALAQALRSKGRARAAGFSWARTAARTVDIYRQVLACG